MRALRIGIIAAATAILFSAGSAGAFDECVKTCAATAKDCLFDAHEELQMCVEDFGCDLMREDFREACFGPDRDREACHAARDELRACRTPCKTDLRDAVTVCKDDATSCIENTCQDSPFLRMLQRYRSR